MTIRPCTLSRIAALVLSTAALAITSTTALADVRAGVTAWEAGDYTRAIAEWRPLAVAGDADAQFNLGQAYKLGRGVAQDLPQAAEWFRQAAAQGHLQGEDNLGLVLYELARKDEALPWLERSASRGEPRAQYVLAAELFNGERISRDWPRAYALMKRASDAGLQRASAALVQMDQHIPLEQRQAGLQLAQAMERSEGQARVEAMTAAAPRAPARAPTRATPPSPVRPAALPPSAPGVSYTPPPIGSDPASPPVYTPYPSPPPVATPASVRPAASAPPRPAATTAPVAAAGAWRVQLGAFSARASAVALWSRLASRMNGAQPSYIAAGTIVRLQAGPYASRAAAERVCASLRPQPCIPVGR
ncbi:MAG: SPOR domain-containing protein [Sphingopyxis sp.]